jgi:carboxyl-terminal processing protease
LKVAAPTFTPLRGRISESAFFFVRQLVAGQVRGFENYRADKQNFSLVVQPNEFQVTDKLFEAYRAFTVSEKLNGLSAENINSQMDFAKSRLRAEIATANYSSEAGQQVLLENDPQILKAVESIPQARQLFVDIATKK